jgi:hypothetical protein
MYRLDFGNWIHMDSPNTAQDFFDSNKGETGSFIIDHRFLVQYRGIHGFFSSEGVQGFSVELMSVVLIRAHTPSGSPL